ncbi:MAG: hypothetical protein ACOY82_04715 [Pseudomonadota bacterium]
MDFSEFVAVIGAQKEPELKDFERISVFAHDADRDLLWTALGHAGIHPVYRALLAQALHRRIVEDLERERARQRRLEEEARLDAAKDEPPRPTRRRQR